MARYRHQLPQLEGRPFLTDGGLETTLISTKAWTFRTSPPSCCWTREGAAETQALPRALSEDCAGTRRRLILDSATWRANPDWGGLLGYGAEALRRVNHRAIDEMLALRERWETPLTPCVVSGAIGPRGDAYKAGRMTRMMRPPTTWNRSARSPRPRPTW